MDYKSIVYIVIWCVSLLMMLPMLHFVFFAIVGIFKYKKFPKTDIKKKYGIIIPARNEENVVGNLIESIRKNNYPQDKLHIFVIAHNCTDKTAEVCRNLSEKYQDITVYEYNNSSENTMGYAFRYLFTQIEKDFGTQNYDGFFLFNADNILSENYFEKMNDAYIACGEKDVITSFRNTKNYGSNVISGLYGVYFISGCRLESRGRTVFGCSTRVQGTGYVINSEIVKNGWPYVTLTEDWEFSADQILQGRKIKYCDEAVFYDEQPVSNKIMLRQRLRWSKGHLLVCVSRFKALIKKLFTKAGGGERVNRFSVYDILINILPIGVINAFMFVIQLILLAIAPLFGISAGLVWKEWAFYTAIAFAVSYVLVAINAILIISLERKRIKNATVWKQIGVVLAWPIFLLLSLPIEVVALFSKNVVWKAIPHNDTTNFEKLNEKTALNDTKTFPILEAPVEDSFENEELPQKSTIVYNQPEVSNDKKVQVNYFEDTRR